MRYLKSHVLQKKLKRRRCRGAREEIAKRWEWSRWWRCWTFRSASRPTEDWLVRPLGVRRAAKFQRLPLWSCIVRGSLATSSSRDAIKCIFKHTRRSFTSSGVYSHSRIRPTKCLIYDNICFNITHERWVLQKPNNVIYIFLHVYLIQVSTNLKKKMKCSLYKTIILYFLTSVANL